MTDLIELANGEGLSNQFSKELLDPSIDLAQDFTEIFIDDLIDNETLKEIPFVKTVVGVIKTGISINQLWFAKKLLTFIKEFNSGHIDPEKLLNFRTKINNDKKYRQKVVEQIMVFNERFLEIN